MSVGAFKGGAEGEVQLKVLMTGILVAGSKSLTVPAGCAAARGSPRTRRRRRAAGAGGLGRPGRGWRGWRPGGRPS